MFQLRRSQDRGVSEYGGWLHSHHSFSFADYVDPKRMGFSVLRVINDDVVAPGAGFPKHGHRNMEIISVVLQGSIEHRDSMGHVTQLHAGEVQRMSAGSGITHSEYNPSSTETLRFLQIWIEPDRSGVEPSYEQRSISEQIAQQENKAMSLLVSPDGQHGSMQLHQDVRLFFTNLTAGESLARELNPKRKYYLHVMSGELQVDQQTLLGGDALAIEAEAELKIRGETESEFLFFDLP